MEIAETIKKVIQEIIVPELDLIRAENAEIKAMLQLTNKRLDDINAHLIDHSRRIDETNKRIDETNQKIDKVRDDLIMRIDGTNKRIDRLYEVIVRREEHEKLELRIMKLEQEVAEIKSKVAA